MNCKMLPRLGDQEHKPFSIFAFSPSLAVMAAVASFCALNLPASARAETGEVIHWQDAKPTVSTIHSNDYKNYISVSYENDLIGGGTDQYYTSGVQINYFNIESKPPRYIGDAADRFIGFDVNEATATSFTLGQKIFTPQDITIAAPQNQDRPWAGWLYATVAFANVHETYTDQLGLTLGVVGPASMAEQTQKFIHKHVTDSPEPQGWDNQLHTEPGAIVSWNRRWQNFASFPLAAYRVQFEPDVTVAAGNVNTYAGVGGTVTFGPNQAELRDTPPRVAPAMPGSGYFDLPHDQNWDWYVFAGINGRAVARDIFLDGNTFRDSASVDKKNFVADGNAGLALTYGQTRIAYTVVYRTKEFDGQEDPAIFGSLTLTRRF